MIRRTDSIDTEHWVAISSAVILRLGPQNRWACAVQAGVGHRGARGMIQIDDPVGAAIC
jgi:hypothetical protein